MVKNFAITGVAGYIVPRHLDAIRDTGHRVVAALDPHDSVGILDRYAHDTSFFTEYERFDRHLEKLRRGPEADRVHYVSVCSPNYLHDAHCRLALRIGADAICEKPLVINPWNLDMLQQLEAETGQRVYTVLQLRLHPDLVALRDRLRQARADGPHDVTLTYITARGIWYHYSWKGDAARSGGIITNIGVHLFDLMLWLFGACEACRVYHRDSRRAVGYLELARARVRWFLSVDPADLPFVARPGACATHRAIVIDGQAVDFTGGFTDLHTRVYRETLAGRGWGIDAARPGIELAYRVRTAPLSPPDDGVHPRFQLETGP